MSSTPKRWKRILSWRCGMGWKLIVLDKSPTSDHLPPKKSQLPSNDMGWQFIFDGREGGGILGKKFSSLISFWGGLSVTDGIRGSSSRHRWALGYQCYTPTTAIHYFGYFGFHCTPLIHWTHHSSIVGGGVKWWPTLSCAAASCKGKYLVPRVRGREYRRNTNEHKSKYDGGLA